jgi:pimeloyl-ACP methyl ester carboxylesterase
MEKVYISMLNLSYLSSRGMMLSVQCHEEAPFSTSDQYSDMIAQYPELKGMFQYSIMGELIYRTCKIWGAGRAGERANQAVVSDLPALILTGEFDPVTPPRWGFHAAETLSRSYAYEYPGIGHGASIVNSCPMSMLTDFWQNPENEPDDSCIQNMK